MMRFERLLRDSEIKRENKVVALKFLVHLVGDVHQPLHVGRRGDKGGKTIKVSWFGAHSNLRRVWDEHMINATKLSFYEFAQFIEHPTPQEVAAWQSSTNSDRIEESMKQRETVCDIGNGNLSYAYRDKNLLAAKRRLLQAGIRSAGLLDAIFSE